MWITALLMGLAGSLHCVGMCSPLSMAITGVSTQVMVRRLIYNGGRILTYGIAGAVISSLGFLIPLGGVQPVLSFILGALLITAGVTGISSLRIPKLTSGIARFVTFLRIQFSYYIQKKTYGSTFILGLLNGLLPCGLTFIALTFCLTLDGPLSGFNFMVLFGAGTLPAMIGIPTLLTYAVKTFHLNLSRVLTVLLLISGCVLIGRAFMPTHHATATSTQEVVCR
jgi:sulfite exporter TauE/SafE